MKFAELSALYHQPLFDLISQSRAVHLQHWRGEEIQRCTLLSIKTGGCSEDCAYCAQSAHYSSGLEREDLLSLESVLAVARRARSQGATRFCMGAAWRGVRDGSEKFERVLEIVREVSCLGMEVCVTLGEIGPLEAKKLRDAAGTPELLLTIITSILPRNFTRRLSAHTHSRIGSTQLPLCSRAECRFVVAALSVWANRRPTGCECWKSSAALIRLLKVCRSIV